MNILFIILLSIFYLINSKIYILTFGKLSMKKYNNNWMYNLIWLVLGSIIIVKQFSKLLFDNSYLLAVMSALMLLFQVIAVIFFYSGSIKQKIIVIGVPITICMFLDVIAIFVCTAGLHISVNAISKLSLGNVVASGVESFLTVLVYALFVLISSRKKSNINMLYEYNEILFIAVLNLIIVIPGILILNNVSVAKMNLSVIVITQFGIIALLSIFFIYTIFRKNLSVYETNFKNQSLEKEMQYYNSISESFDQLRKLRHDMSSHFSSIYSLLKINQPDKALKYLESIYDKIEYTRDISTVEDKMVAIILTDKFQTARKKGIRLDHTMILAPCLYNLLNRMNDMDKTALFSNLLNNAIEAAELSQEKELFFEMRAGSNGKYDRILITCENSRPNQTVIPGKSGILTTKKDKAGHGLGTQIINQVVTKYNGKIHYDYTDNTFTVTIIFERGEKS